VTQIGTESIRIVVCPNGIDTSGDNYQLSVFLGVILSGGSMGTLADFEDFQNWPNTLINNELQLQLTFQVTGSPTFIGTADIDQSQLKADLWTNLFPKSTTYVEQTPANQPQANSQVMSFPIKPIHDFLTTGTYQQLPPTKPPSFEDVMPVFGDIRPTVIGVSAGEGFREIQQRQAQERAYSYANDFTDATPAEALAALALYFTPTTPAAPPGVTPNPLDFHGAQVFIGEHRMLQRALGLTFDVTIPISAVSQNGLVSPTLSSEMLVSAALTVPHNVQSHVVRQAADQSPPGDFSGSGLANYVGISPQTRCFASTTVFEAYSDTTDPGVLPIASRLLTVGDDTRFVPHTIDIELAGIRTNSFSAALQSAAHPVAVDGSSPATYIPQPGISFPPPQVDSGGLSLSLVNRGLLHVAQISRATELFNAFAKGPSFTPEQTPLYASDLTRGLILDVYDTTPGTWYSTNRRQVTYTSPAPGNTPPAGSSKVVLTGQDDEGGTQAPPTQSMGAGGLFYTVSETVLRYRGWSNAVPLPGTMLADQDSALGAGGGPFGDEIQIDLAPVPGSLPRLRFGRTYYLRARIVDIAGNVVSYTLNTPVDVENGENVASGPILYGRTEVVGSPDVVIQNSSPNNYPTPGEGRQRLVIRDIDVANGATTSNRVLAPSRTTEQFAEVHGMFDTGSGNSLDLNAYMSVITQLNQYGYERASGSYPAPPQDFQNPSKTPPAPTAIDVTQAVPYLPDPLSRGGVMTLDLGTHSAGTFGGPMAQQTLTFDFSPASGDASAFSPPGSGSAWPDYRPVMLTLTPPPSRQLINTPPVVYDATTRTITFALDPADTVYALVASTFNAADVDTYGMGTLIPSVDAKQAAAGAYYGITPTTELELIYAVTQPLIAPALTIDTPNRLPGDTFVNLNGGCTYSPKSTGHIEVQATWEDPIDVPGSSYAPALAVRSTASHADRAKRGHAEHAKPRHDEHAKRGHHEDAKPKRHAAKAERPKTSRDSHITVVPGPPITLAPRPSGTLQGPGTPNPNPGNPKNVHVFKAPPPVPADTLELGGELIAIEGFGAFDNVKANQPLTGFDNFGNLALASVDDSFGGARQEFHDTKHRVVNYSAVATTRFASFYNTTDPTGSDYVNPTDLTVSSAAPFQVDIKSTARPAALKIPYVVPIYDWQDVTTNTFSSEVTTGRSPSALRVFIERPWWSSGADELLGVILSQNSFLRLPIGEPEDLYVTDWGSDPVFASSPLPSPHPNPFSFPNAVTGQAGLTIEENASVQVSVLGHNVGYDVVRDLWYADVAIDSGAAYTPFIRLALARYQQYSIAGVELGRISQADIMSLEPGRSVSIIPYAEGGSVYLNVALSGYSYSEVAGLHRLDDGSSPAPGLAQVLVEEREPSISDEDLGWVAITDPITMTPATSGGMTTWSALGIEIPSRSGQYRLYINQYEILPSEFRAELTDSSPVASSPPPLQARDAGAAREAGRRKVRAHKASTSGSNTPPGYRLLYQDMIPVPNHLTTRRRFPLPRTGR
jgi:hypothetical protein